MMSVICKIIVYSADESFSAKIKEILNGERYVVKTVNLFTDIIGLLQKELFDVAIVDTETAKEVDGLLRIFDNILLGMPIIVASDEEDLRVEEGINSKFYFLNKFSGKDEWRSVLKVAVDENYIIASKSDLK